MNRHLSGKVYYSPERNQIVEHIMDDGLTWVYKKNEEQMRAEYPDMEIMDEMEAIERLELGYVERFKDSFRIISRDDFEESLYVLPPKDWFGQGNTSSFKMIEYQCGNWTSIFVQKGKRYYTFIGQADLSHEEIMVKVKEYETKKGCDSEMLESQP